MNNMKKSWLAILCVASITFPAFSANYAVEARGDAMGGVGVVAGNYLTAPFYNPALAAIYRRNDDAGMILPSLGLSYNDPGNLVDNIDLAADLINEVKSGNYSRAPELSDLLTSMNDKTLTAHVGGVVAFAIPNQYVSMNLFGKAYVEAVVESKMADPSCTGFPMCLADESSVNAVSIGVTEAGLTLAKYQTVLGQHMSFGISPKLQRIYSYVYEATFDNYDLMDLLDNGKGETTFNIDAGALWFYGPLRVGFSASNLIGRTIHTKTITSAITHDPIEYAYRIRPQYTLGVGLIGDYLSLSVDYDLNEDKRFLGFNDNTQMLRVGGEVDLMRQLKLRGGYYKNLAYSDKEGTFTAGVGLSLLKIVEIDAGVRYTNKNAKGAFVNFLNTF